MNDRKTTLIIIPTYNERDNITELIPRIFAATGHRLVHILIVDDNSPDKTAELVTAMRESYPEKLFLIRREGKLGLGTAYVAGFKWGFERGYEVYVEMDADFSHHPRYLDPMIRLSDQYDFIIGSRYVAGGGVKGWGLGRKLLSRYGSLYAAVLLRLPFKDLTGGFIAWRADVLGKIDLDQIFSRGFCFQMELKCAAHKLGFKGVEMPIIFENRVRGTSKMTKDIFFEALVNVWKIRSLYTKRLHGNSATAVRKE